MVSLTPHVRAVLLLWVAVVTTLALQSPPLITKQPPPTELLFQVAQREDENDRPFIIECEAKGDPMPKYHWFKNGKPFQWAVYDTRISQQPDRGTLVITSPKDEDIGSYQCKATNEYGTATSNTVFVRKSDLNSFPDQPAITISANEGDMLKLECRPPEGYPKPTVYWMNQGDQGSLYSISSSRKTVDPFGNLWFSNVTLDDGSDGFVYACSATSPFRNEYKVGNRVRLNAIRTGSVSSNNKRPPTEQYVSTKNIVARRGDPVEIWCIYGGTPLPKTQWQKSKGGLDLSDGRVRMNNFGKSLFIQKARFEDEGEYVCTASNGVGTAKTRSFNLKLESVPFFTKEPEIRNAAEGETVVFECAADAVPKPEIQWIYNGEPIADSPANPRRIITPNKITINNLKKSDTANYGCNATNNIGYVYKDVYVNVLELPPEIVEKPQDVATVVGTDVRMVCKVFGAPHPQVKWLRNGIDGQELTGGRYQIAPDGTMVIKDVSFPDAGSYHCLATSVLGEDSANGTLVVKERTRITQGPEDYQVVAGNSATFRCTAAVDSTLDVEIGWLADGVPINFGIEPRFIKTTDNSLTITKTTELDSKQYTCVASTELDQATANATLKVEDVPNAPTLGRVHCREHDAKVEWRPNGDNRAPILAFTIQYNTSFTPDTWVDASESPSSTNSIELGLSPWANYTFRVIAQNRVGPSLPSGHSEVCSTPKALPKKNPENVVGRGTQPDNLVIRWTPMSEIDHNARKFSYRVSWRRNDSQELFQDVITDWRRDHLVVPNQPTYVPYVISVEAQNELGESAVTPAPVIGFSGEDVPTAAPTDFRLVNVYDGKSAMFSWTPVDNSTIRGEFMGYKIQTWTEKEGRDKKRQVTFTPGATQGLVNTLKPHALNKAQILAFNAAYEGPASEALSFTTPQGRPSAVDSLEAIPMGSSAFFLIWKKPQEPNGVLTGYKVQYQLMKGLNLGPVLDREPQISDPRTTRAKLAGLKPSTKYRITVRALTEAGEGPPYFIERSTKNPEPRPPDRPGLVWAHVRSEDNTSGDSLRVTWLPNTEGSPGSHFLVQYRRHGEASWLTSPIEYYDDSILLRGLEPGQVYEIRTVSIDGDYMTHSDTEEVETYPPDGPYIQATQSVATSGWFIAMMLAVALLLLILVLVCIVRRNRGGKYDVQDREHAHGRGDLYPEDGFQEYQQPLESKLPPGSRGSLASDVKHPAESDTDSMAEYGDDAAEGMNEDGSFIGQYGRGARQPPPPPPPATDKIGTFV